MFLVKGIFFENTSDVVERQVRQLARLIDDLLNVSRITSGKIRLNKDYVDAGSIRVTGTGSLDVLGSGGTGTGGGPTLYGVWVHNGGDVTGDDLADYVERVVRNFDAQRDTGERFAQWVARAEECALL